MDLASGALSVVDAKAHLGRLEGQWGWRKDSLNVNPGLVNQWLINRGVSPFTGDSSALEGTPPLIMDGFLNPGSTLMGP